MVILRYCKIPKWKGQVGCLIYEFRVQRTGMGQRNLGEVNLEERL